MASSLKKLRKLRRDPALFVKDLVIKKLGGDPAVTTGSGGSIDFKINDFELIDGLIVLNKPAVVAELRRLKDSKSNSALTLTWRR